LIVAVICEKKKAGRLRNMQQEPNVVGSGKMEERKRGKRMKLFNNT